MFGYSVYLSTVYTADYTFNWIYNAIFMLSLKHCV